MLLNNQQCYFFPISGDSLRALSQRLDSYIPQLLNADTDLLYDLSYEWSLQANHSIYRVAAIGANGHSIAQQLRIKYEQVAAVDASIVSPDVPKQLVFVFPEQGIEWVRVGQRLLVTNPVFYTSINQTNAALAPYLEWSLLDVIQGNAGIVGLHQLVPIIFSIQLALVAMWQSWGIEPAAVIGYGIGEIAAAYTAGQLTLTEAIQIVLWRSQITRVCSQLGIQPQTLLMGQKDLASLQLLPEILRDKSPPTIGHIPRFRFIEDPHHQPSSHSWVEILRKPNQIDHQFKQLLQLGYRHFIEISLEPVFTPSINLLLHADQTIKSRASVHYSNVDSQRTLLQNLCDLYLAGHPLTWRYLWPKPPRAMLQTQTVGTSATHYIIPPPQISTIKTTKSQLSSLQHQLSQTASIYHLRVIETYLREQISDLLRVPIQTIGIQIPLSQLGFDSMMVTALARQLEQQLDLASIATNLWRYPTINTIVPFLVDQLRLKQAPQV